MAAINTYDVGDIVRLAGTFKNQSDAFVDPGGVRVKVKNPLGTSTTYVYGVDAGVMKDATGQYHLDIDADTEGTWYYRWEGLTSNKGADEESFLVRDSQFY